MKIICICSRLALGSAFAASALVGCTASESGEGGLPGEVATSGHSLTARCGNGVLEPERGEECDDGVWDGTATSGVGCLANCTIAPGYTCFGERPSVCTLPDQSDAPVSYGFASHAKKLEVVSPFVGREFWTAFPLNNTGAQALGIRVAGTTGTTGSIYNTAGDLISNFSIPAGGVIPISITPTTRELSGWQTSGAVDKGIRISANDDVRVIATTERQYSTDSWGVWSSQAIGKEYVVLEASTSNSANWQIAVIGVEENTSVVINNAGGLEQAAFTLNAGQAYRYRSASQIVGWTVRGTKPIAVIAGNECTDTPSCSACDVTAEQLAPVSLWSREYVVAPTFGNGINTSRARHVVVAQEADTRVTFTRSDGIVATATLLQRGSNYVFSDALATQFGYFISADKPVGVVSNISVPASDYDPSMVTWPPIDGYVSEARMPTSGVSRSYTHFLTIITRTSATGNIRVEGSPPSTTWYSISTTGYSYARVNLGSTARDTLIQGLNGVKFAAIAVGGNSSVSYGYSSPYDIGLVGGTTTCYLGKEPPDFEEPFVGSEACDEDDEIDQDRGLRDDEDALDDYDSVNGTISIKLNSDPVQLVIPCHDNFFGIDENAMVHGFIDFNRNGLFDLSGEHAEAACVGATASDAGTATLEWNGPNWGSEPGFSVLRLRICEGKHDCSEPTGFVASGEVEDHRIHIGTCGDGYRDTFEECDDGNTDDGDGCNAICDGVENGFECEEDGNNLSVCDLVKAPTINTPSNPSAFETPWSAEITGDCLAGMVVTVRRGSEVFCTDTCSSTGSYSCTGNQHGPGSYQLRAEQKSVAGQTSPQSPITNVTVNPPSDGCWIEEEEEGEGRYVPEGDDLVNCRSCVAGSLELVPLDDVPCEGGSVFYYDYMCRDGECKSELNGKCVINGNQRAWKEVNSANVCQWCDGFEDPSQWTTSDRTTCDENDDGKECTLNACVAGLCRHPLDDTYNGCLINGACVPYDSKQPGNNCKACLEGEPRDKYSDLKRTTACTDVVLGPTPRWARDECDGAGRCERLTDQCDIGGVLYDGGLNPGNDCQKCDLSLDPPTEWTNLDPGTDCTDDRLPWTTDECDGYGTCVHEPTGKCVIGGDTYEKGPNPNNPCEWCNPSASASSWSPMPKGTECGTGDEPDCTSDVCDGAGHCENLVSTGCLIEGECVADRSSDPLNPCLECNAAYSTDGYSPKSSGESCGSNAACDGGGQCWPLPSGKCTIAGVEYSNGEINPDNECQRCDSYMDPGHWYYRAQGAACSGDDDVEPLPCTSASCDGVGVCNRTVIFGCVIGDACVVAGARDPDDSCKECDPARSTISYVSSAPGTVCEDDGNAGTQDVCGEMGECLHIPKGTCNILNQLYDAGSINPDFDCLWCDPGESPNSWTPRPKGSHCSSDGLTCTSDECDGAGTCTNEPTTGCLVEGRCYGVGGVPEVGDCLVCDLDNPDGFSPKNPGEVCSSEDGDPGILDICNDEGDCTHTARGECVIDGKVWVGGAINPENECEWCEPDPAGGATATAWSPRAPGIKCVDDELSCTIDICGENGECGHQASDGWCAIDRQCMENGTKSSNDPCLVCDPMRSTTDWVRSAAPECNKECQANEDCGPGEECVKGECKPIPDCRVNDDCGPGQECVNGVCVPAPDCRVNGDCGPGQECVSGVCKQVPECRADSDCPNGVCADGKCKDGSLEGGAWACSAFGAGSHTAGGAGFAGLLSLLSLLSLGLGWVRRRR